MQGTRHFGVNYVVGSPLELVGFYDSDWASDPIDRKSTLGYVYMISQVPILFSIKKQHTISLYLFEAEYKGVVNTATKCVWLQGFIRELGVAFDSPTVIWCENKSKINISTDPFHRHRIKRIEIHMHYIRSLVHDQVTSL